jgi:hypothetical protein
MALIDDLKKEFLAAIRVEYPIPWRISIWGAVETPYQDDIVSFWDMLKTVVFELRSDLDVSETITMYGPSMTLPEGTNSIAFAKLTTPFPGNRLVKADYDLNTRLATCRYYPAELTIRRMLTLEDVLNHKLDGDALIYFKCYFLSKLAYKEHQVLSAVTLDTDNASINLEALKSFADEKFKRYLDLKQGIFIYGGYTY